MKKIIVLGMLLVLVATGCSLAKKEAKNELSIEDAKTKILTYINENLMQPGSAASIKEISEENGLYKMTVSLPNNQEVMAYATKDGKKFFPQAMDLDKNVDEQKEESAPEPSNDIVKKEKAEVELFVMSHCPYGTQIEKGILPVVAKLGDKIDFSLKFCDYAMHGEKELDEQLNQYCIQKEQEDKLTGYLQCFLADGDGEGCLKSSGIDTSKMKNCVAATEKEFKVKEKYKDQSTWVSGKYPSFDVFKDDNLKYGVKGSPTLIVNGSKASSGRDSASLLKVICSGFENPPAECNEVLSSASPAPGFGFENAGGANTNASCN